MPTIIFSPTTQPQQIEDFPPDCERTIKGAMHVRPGSTQIVSQGELVHLKTTGLKFTEVKPKPPPLPAATPAKAAIAPDFKAPLADTNVAPDGAAEPDSKGSDKSSRKK